MAAFLAPPCTSFYRSSAFLTPCSSNRRSTALRAAAVRGSAVTRAQRTVSARWVPSRLAVARPAARKACLEELDTTNMLLRQRIVFLGSPVDDTSADLIISQLLLLDAEDQTKDIKLFINSPGGSITAGMGVYDAMKFCKADVSTVCFGLAASMGAFLLAAGTKGKRYCMPNARIMIHQPSGGAGGKVTEMGLQIREMMYEKIKINKIMSRITGKSEEQIDEDTKFDYFMSPSEAKDYGIVDNIIDEGKPGLVAPLAGSVPPPKSRVWYLWKASGPTRKIMKHLPSEEKLIHNGNGSATGDDGKLKEATAT
ncbi:ATP-dependent Clp protease proteolytic subunit 1 [Zea mays]|uniref:ATP-dependent Clp protease proteolytic subunit n=1 Tax=Zea mays TaxID=4577 RepID=C0P421_MAIZE|nr:ATP-dependent Clp protease proteolytic subunit 1 [Zea mays]ACN27737.1 unknown [Zea mays]AQK91722.1 ATP-dependent Clp protease proteolytic subunit [Zea mays]|eukprot:NP_001149210.2 ATP-dependent Clp protease proteolytic subunit 1 [Zea mays]